MTDANIVELRRITAPGREDNRAAQWEALPIGVRLLLVESVFLTGIYRPEEFDVEASSDLAFIGWEALPVVFRDLILLEIGRIRRCAKAIEAFR